MKLNISFNEISRDQLLKFLSVLQDEIEKMEDKEIKNICNAGNFIVFGVDGHIIFIPTSIRKKGVKMKGTEMNLLKVRNITTDTYTINGFSIIVDNENLIVKTPDRKKGIKIDKDGITTNLGKWNFYKMHPLLQGIAIGLIGLATVGWTLIGIWFLYFLMIR